MLSYPTHNHHGWIVDTDASQYALGGILSQIQESIERVIAYASRRLSAVQQRYCVTKKELLALKWSIFDLTCMAGVLLYEWTTLASDFERTAPEIQRWMTWIQENEFQVEYRAGKAHGSADGLSRLPEIQDLLPEEEASVPCRKHPCQCKELIDSGQADPYAGEADCGVHPDIGHWCHPARDLLPR